MKIKLGKCIGKGAYGSVYQGLDTETGQVVAVKKIPLGRSESEAKSIMVTSREIFNQSDRNRSIKTTIASKRRAIYRLRKAQQYPIYNHGVLREWIFS
jgi:serine/threonine protein kinase